MSHLKEVSVPRNYAVMSSYLASNEMEFLTIASENLDSGNTSPSSVETRGQYSPPQTFKGCGTHPTVRTRFFCKVHSVAICSVCAIQYVGQHGYCKGLALKRTNSEREAGRLLQVCGRDGNARLQLV